MKEFHVKVKVKYLMLNGIEVTKIKELPVLRIIDSFPTQFSKGDFISQSEEEPQGMFVITWLNEKQKRIALKEINCDPIHWKGDGNGRAKGPNEDCKKISCPYLSNCPISAHIMMTDAD